MHARKKGALMKPNLICHMITTVDGRILPKQWHPPFEDSSLYEDIHGELAGDAWLVGRVTGAEFALLNAPYPEMSSSIEWANWSDIHDRPGELPKMGMEFIGCEPRDNGGVWLRYRVIWGKDIVAKSGRREQLMAENECFTQLCIVVDDVERVNANWAQVLGMKEAQIETVFPDGIHHYTNGEAAAYTDLRVAKYDLGNIILELLEPGPTPSPWRTFLDKNGQGVMHVCLFVGDRKVIQQKLGDIGVGLPYHVGYYPGGSYSYVDSKKQLGLELSVNHQGDYSDLIGDLLGGLSQPLDELR